MAESTSFDNTIPGNMAIDNSSAYTAYGLSSDPTLDDYLNKFSGFTQSNASNRTFYKNYYQAAREDYLNAIDRMYNAEQAGINRDFQASEAQKNRDFQEYLSNTSYQRAVADMQKAGLNPLLAYSQGGSSTPSGSAASGSAASGSSGSSGGQKSILESLAKIVMAVAGLVTTKSTTTTSSVTTKK